MKKRPQIWAYSCAPHLTKIALVMKMSFAIILVTCMQASATGYSQEVRLTLNMNQVPISKLLKTIESKTDYHFVYSSNFFPSELIVSVNVKQKPVSEILKQVLSNTG